MKIGIIGYGQRARSVMNSLKKADSRVTIQAVADVRQDFFDQTREDGGQIQLYATPEEMMANEALDGILIGTRCSLHTEMALKVLPTGIPLFLEKPVATNMDDLRRLKAGNETRKSGVVVSFPLRASAIVQHAKEIIDSGQIGTVEHVQAVNNVPYGGVYFHSWYRDEEETGGLFLQKATHDFDYLTYMIGQRPVDVTAMTSKQVFKGTKPAGLTCEACDENETCTESQVKGPEKRGWTHCCFAEDTGNEDSGSALVRYESGMHLSYSQNFFARRKAAARGATFIGYKGTLQFDFYTNEVKVHMHHLPRIDTYSFDAAEAHFGGDGRLAADFIAMMQGEKQGVSSLDDGLMSALLCIKAREAARTRTFQTVDWE